jgi:hypothetical protein
VETGDTYCKKRADGEHDDDEGWYEPRWKTGS